MLGTSLENDQDGSEEVQPLKEGQEDSGTPEERESQSLEHGREI